MDLLINDIIRKFFVFIFLTFSGLTNMKYMFVMKYMLLNNKCLTNQDAKLTTLILILKVIFLCYSCIQKFCYADENSRFRIDINPQKRYFVLSMLINSLEL